MCFSLLRLYLNYELFIRIHIFRSNPFYIDIENVEREGMSVFFTLSIFYSQK